MSRIKFDRPLRVELIFSTWHKIFIYGVHLLAVSLLLLPFGLPVTIKFLIAFYIVLSFLLTMKKFGESYAGSLRYLENANWIWIKDGEEHKLQLTGGILLQPRLITLTFQDQRANTYSWTLFPDSLDKESFRRLRILLRHSTADTHSSPV